MTLTGYRWFKQMADGGAVTRYHTRRMLVPQCNAAHQWGVAMVLWAAGVANDRLLAAALTHDVHEYATGDSPANAKWANPALTQVLHDMAEQFNGEYGLNSIKLSGEEQLLLRWADLFELVHHAIVEVRMGNSYAREIINNGVSAMRKLLNSWSNDGHLALPPDSITSMSADLFNEAQVFLF